MPHTRPEKRRGFSDEKHAAMDPIIHAHTVVQESNNMIHHGRGFTLALEGTIPAAGTATLLAKIPVDSQMHWQAGRIDVEDTPVRVELRDNVIVSADGTPVTARCNNRILDNTPDAQIFTNPTITDPGDLLIPSVIRQAGGPPGQAGAAVIEGPGAEWIWTNMNITLSITNNSATNPIEFEGIFFWYETDANYQSPELQ